MSENPDWQSWAAAGIVAASCAALILRAMRSKRKSNGCSSCGENRDD